MKKIYACLIGQWVCLNDDPKCAIGEYHKSPDLWWKENALIYSPSSKDKKLEHSLYGSDYVNLFYKGKDYRINPIFIQVVSEPDE